MTDQLTPSERAGATDCVIEMALAWLQRPLGGLTEAERGQAIAEVCLLISQMRHRDPAVMEAERRRWIDRVTVRLCTQCSEMRGYHGAVQQELERRVTVALCAYHEWRERHAPVVERTATGPSDGGDVL